MGARSHNSLSSSGRKTSRPVREWLRNFATAYAVANVAHRIGRGQFVILAFGLMLAARSVGQKLPYPVKSCEMRVKFWLHRPSEVAKLYAEADAVKGARYASMTDGRDD